MSGIMAIDGMDDFEMRLRRQDAFWDCEVLDRPCVYIQCPAKEPVCEIPVSKHATFEERWMDAGFQVESAVARVKNTVYMGDALPVAIPDLGPDYFPALYGGEIVFEDATSYIKPFLKEWGDAGNLHLSREHPYWKKMDELYDTFLEAGRGLFYVGWPDLHPGADCLVGIRGPQELALDLFDEADSIKKMLGRVSADFFSVYDYYYQKLSMAGQACTGWPGVVSRRKWHVPSNDFSYMISPSQFDEFFLDGLREECDRFEATLHHLDGPGCLNHLDSLLSIKSLSAVQWVWGAGNGEVTDWIDVFKKVQASGKGLQIKHVAKRHLDCLMENLRPEGLWLMVSDVESEEEGAEVLKKIAKWI